MPTPISLTDDQMTALFDAATPLAPHDRSAFLRSVAAYFSGRETVGDGELHRAIAELQRDYFKAPSFNENRAPQQLAKKFGRVAS
jgi:hypothetical protein